MVESNVYFPPDSVNWQYFQKSGDYIFSPLIGNGILFTISVLDTIEKNAAWSFPDPHEKYTHIRDYVAFSYGEVDLLTERTG